MQLTLDVGDKSLPIPDTVKTVTGVSLVALRGRRFPVHWLKRRDFDEIRNGRPDFRGVPMYWNVYGREVQFWPAAAHCWQVILTISDTQTQDEADARNAA